MISIMVGKNWYKERYKQDAQRVMYLQDRVKRRVCSPYEAQELTNLTHKHKQKNSQGMQELLDRIASSGDKPARASFQPLDFSEIIEVNTDNVAVSRNNILASIKAFRKNIKSS